MPDRLRTPCGCPTCPLPAVRRGYCEQHLKERNKRIYEEDYRQHGSHSAKGYGRRHTRWARMVLARDIVCRDCGARLAVHADHVTPVKSGGSWTRMDNGQALCSSCHGKKTRRENSK